MARSYEMTILVRGVDPARTDAVKEAAQSCWDFEDWFPLAGEDDCCAYQARGYDSLCGNEQEGEFAERLSRQIWTANGSYCEVEIRALFLDDLPYASYSFDEDDFEQSAAQSQTQTSDDPA